MVYSDKSYNKKIKRKFKWRIEEINKEAERIVKCITKTNSKF